MFSSLKVILFLPHWWLFLELSMWNLFCHDVDDIDNDDVDTKNYEVPVWVAVELCGGKAGTFA